MAIDSKYCQDGYVALPESGEPHQKGTVKSTATLLTSSGMGAGMLTLPYAVGMAGPKVGALLLVSGALISCASTVALALGSIKLGAKTYGELVEGAVGTPIRLRGVSVVDACFFVYLLGCVSAFILFIGDFVPAIMQSIPYGSWCDKSVAMTVVTLGVIAPLACMNEMNAMNRLASLSIVAIGITASTVSFKSYYLIADDWENVVETVGSPMQFSWASLRALGCMFYAFDVGSVVPPIAAELHEPTAAKVVKAVMLSSTANFLVYAVLSFLVYFSFAGHRWENGTVGTSSDFTNNFGDDPAMLICRVLLCLTFVCTCTNCCMAAMKSLYVCIGQALHNEHWEPTCRQRLVAVYGSLVPVALLAMNCKGAESVVAILGSVGACPEIVAGPLLLVAFNHVGSEMPRLVRYLLMGAMMSLMLLLWTSSFISLRS